MIDRPDWSADLPVPVETPEAIPEKWGDWKGFDDAGELIVAGRPKRPDRGELWQDWNRDDSEVAEAGAETTVGAELIGLGCSGPFVANLIAHPGGAEGAMRDAHSRFEAFMEAVPEIADKFAEATDEWPMPVKEAFIAELARPAPDDAPSPTAEEVEAWARDPAYAGIIEHSD